MSIYITRSFINMGYVCLGEFQPSYFVCLNISGLTLLISLTSIVSTSPFRLDIWTCSTTSSSLLGIR